MVHLERDGSFVHEDGRILHQDLNVWLARIKDHTLCFSCGRSRVDVPFNDEHVVPQWLLRRYALHDQEITLPNLTRIRYGRYKIPCCQECNELYGRAIEAPMRDLIDRGFDALCDHIRFEGPSLLVTWLSLLMFKLHYRDASLPINQDRRAQEGMIGDRHDWSSLHLVHTFAVTPYTKAIVQPDAIGTLGILKIASGPEGSRFDLMDVPHLRSIMLQMDDILIFHNVTDAGALSSWFAEYTSDINVPLSPIQAREFGLRLAFGFGCLRNPPIHNVRIAAGNADVVEIVSTHDARPEFEEFDKELFGRILYPHLMNFLPVIKVENKSSEEIAEMMKIGDFTSLRDSDGRFRDHSPSE